MKSMSHFEQLRRCGVFPITLRTSDGLNGAGANKSTGESPQKMGQIQQDDIPLIRHCLKQEFFLPILMGHQLGFHCPVCQV